MRRTDDSSATRSRLMSEINPLSAQMEHGVARTSQRESCHPDAADVPANNADAFAFEICEHIVPNIPAPKEAQRQIGTMTRRIAYPAPIWTVEPLGS